MYAIFSGSQRSRLMPYSGKTHSTPFRRLNCRVGSWISILEFIVLILVASINQTVLASTSVSVTITLDPGPLPNSPSNHFTVNYTQGGILQHANQTGGAITITADPSTMVTISGKSSLSGSSERWCLYNCSSVSFNSGAGTSVTYPYYHQFFVPLYFTAYPGPGPISSPTVYCSAGAVSFNASTSVTLWLDAGSNVRFSPDTLPGPNSTIEYFAPYTTFAVYSPSAIGATYTELFGVFASYATSDNSTTTVTLRGTVAGIHLLTSTLTKSPQELWWDWNSKLFLTASILGPSGKERWYTTFPTDFNIYSGMVVNPLFYHQYQLTTSFSVSGGGSGYHAPYFAATNLSSPVSLVLGGTPTTSWFDANSWSVTNPLGGSNSTVRWALSISQSSSGIPSGPSRLNFVYYLQFNINLNVSPTLGGITNPAGQTWTNATSSILITAIAQTGYKFVRWNTNSSLIIIDNSSAAFTKALISGPGTITAVFAKAQSSAPLTPEATFLSTFLAAIICTALVRARARTNALHRDNYF